MRSKWMASRPRGRRRDTGIGFCKRARAPLVLRRSGNIDCWQRCRRIRQKALRCPPHNCRDSHDGNDGDCQSAHTLKYRTGFAVADMNSFTK
jgi:hypothetical protein